MIDRTGFPFVPAGCDQPRAAAMDAVTIGAASISILGSRYRRVNVARPSRGSRSENVYNRSRINKKSIHSANIPNFACSIWWHEHRTSTTGIPR